MLRKPREHRCCVFGRVAMPTCVRGGTHTVVVDTLRWGRCEIDQPAVEKPLRERRVDTFKLAPQRFDPGRVLVKYKNARLSELVDRQRHAYSSSLEAPSWRADEADMAEELIVVKGLACTKKCHSILCQLYAWPVLQDAPRREWPRSLPLLGPHCPMKFSA